MRVLAFFVICVAMGAILMGLSFAQESQSQGTQSAPPAHAVKVDPNGSHTGNANDIPAKQAGKPTLR